MTLRKVGSENCQGCGEEYFNYQIRPVKVGRILMDLCKHCQVTNGIYTNYLKSAERLREIEKIKTAQMQQNEQQALGPNVVITPIEPLVQEAVNLLKKMNPNYFSGVSKINVAPSGQYGHVESGPNRDHTVINLNFNRILQEAGGPNADHDAVVRATAETIAHEKGHIDSYEEAQGFTGGEVPAESEEMQVSNWLKQNI